MDQEEQYLKRQKRIRVIIISIAFIFVVCSITTVVMLPTIRKEIKMWRSNTFLEEARAHLEKGAGAQAIHSAALAVQLDPENIEAIRLAAQLLSKVPHVDAFVYWNKLLKLEGKTEADLLSFVQFCLTLGHLELARPYLQELLDKPKPPVEAFSLGIQFWQIERDGVRSKDLVKQALQYYPNNDLFRVVYSQLLLQSGSSEEIEKAKKMLWELAVSEEINIRLHAYNLLSKNFSLTEVEKQQMLSDKLFSSSEANNVLLGYDLSIRLEPLRKKELIDKAIDQFKHAYDDEQLQFLRWLNNQKAFNETLNVITKKDALEDKQKLMLYLDAIAGLDRWEEVQDLFFDERLPLDPLVLRIFKTRVALALKDQNLAEAQWNYALTLAKDDPQKLLFVADYFDKLGAWDYAWKAYMKALDFPHHAMAVARRMITVAEIRKDTQGILDVLRKLTVMFPQEEVPKVDLAYIELLLNRNTEGALYSLEAMLDQPLQTMALRSAAALGYLRTRQIEKASQIFRDTPLNLNTALPAWKAVYAAVLFESGDVQAAQQITKMIDVTRLKPEEYELIAKILETPKAVS